MSRELELERTYLAKFLPNDLKNSPSKEIIDIYFPKNVHRPNIRIRQSGDLYFITKKTPTELDTFSQQVEETISLTAEEFSALSTVDDTQAVYLDYSGEGALKSVKVIEQGYV